MKFDGGESPHVACNEAVGGCRSQTFVAPIVDGAMTSRKMGTPGAFGVGSVSQLAAGTALEPPG